MAKLSSILIQLERESHRLACEIESVKAHLFNPFNNLNHC